MHSALLSIGGIGLFLFGRALMTSGLRKLAGDRLRHWIGRATRTPLSGALTGAAVTGVLQSSGATTVIAVGFAGAGLITFSQSLGIIFGANIGSTITGWMVALVGFKMKLGTACLPLLFIGAILYLARDNRLLRGSGKALAGFSLLFLGIEYLQDGLAGAHDLVDLGRFDASAPGGRLLLLLLGVALTLVTQSSATTVAAGLTALNAGLIDLPQAAAIAIGADIGTTATAALATIGGNTASRRTGFAHVIFNLLTGVGAFLLLPVFLTLCEARVPHFVSSSPEVVVVSFHTLFNVLGVLAVLPFTSRFARLIERLFPERGNALTLALDPRLLGDPAVASGALESACRTLSASVLRSAASILSGQPRREPEAVLDEAVAAVSEARDYAVRAGEFSDETNVDARRLFALLHILDHVDRFAERAREEARFKGMASRADLARRAREISGDFEGLARDIGERGRPATLARLESLAAEFESDKARFRGGVIQSAARGEISATDLDRALDGARWLRRLVYHAWRIAHYAAELENARNA